MSEESIEEKSSQEEPISTFFERKHEEDETRSTSDTSSAETQQIEQFQEVSVLDKKKEENKRRYQRSKEKLLALRANQVHGCELVLFNINNKLRKITIQSEKEYLNLIEDLIGTLKDNEMLSDYLLTPY